MTIDLYAASLLVRYRAVQVQIDSLAAQSYDRGLVQHTAQRYGVPEWEADRMLAAEELRKRERERNGN